jgi:hypothetical protein
LKRLPAVWRLSSSRSNAVANFAGASAERAPASRQNGDIGRARRKTRQIVERNIVMHVAGPTDDEAIAALDQLKRSIRMAFCGVMQSTRLPPMAAMSLAAMAVGSLYLEVAAAHKGDNPCPCGWRPRGAADVEALQTSLALATDEPRADFPAMQAAGNA